MLLAPFTSAQHSRSSERNTRSSSKTRVPEVLPTRPLPGVFEQSHTCLHAAAMLLVCSCAYGHNELRATTEQTAVESRDPSVCEPRTECELGNHARCTSRSASKYYCYRQSNGIHAGIVFASLTSNQEANKQRATRQAASSWLRPHVTAHAHLLPDGCKCQLGVRNKQALGTTPTKLLSTSDAVDVLTLM